MDMQTQAAGVCILSPTYSQILLPEVVPTYVLCAVDYAFVLSPNQTPYRDMYFLEKLSGLGADDGVAVNTVFTRLCWLMGVWPAVYASLLLPSARSGNKVLSYTLPAANATAM